MGVGSSCTGCQETKYRFKNFVVSVYPEDIRGGANEDALGKLNSYVGSNLERIPRVCRKISKLLHVQIQTGRTERVAVSIAILRSLIANAVEVDGFVPHSMDICSLLLSQTDLSYRIGAADILVILCYRLEKDSKSEQSRRLIADTRNRLLPPLEKMCSERIGSPEDPVGWQCRHAAVLALGHMATCLSHALADRVNDLLYPILVDLVLLLREVSQHPMRVTDHQQLELLQEWTPPTDVRVPEDKKEREVLFIKTCTFGVGAVSRCVTTTGVDAFLARIVTFIGKRNAWTIPFVPSLVFGTLATFMQDGPQQLGFTVCQCLCKVGTHLTDVNVRCAVLRAIKTCVDGLVLSGGRPQAVMHFVERIIRSPIDLDAATSTAVLDTQHAAILSLISALLRGAYRQRTVSQLHFLLEMMSRLLRDAVAPENVTHALEYEVAAAPYIRAIPVEDRKAPTLRTVVDPYLNGTNIRWRLLAAQALRRAIAGTPDGDASGPEDSGPTSALYTDAADVAAVEQWVITMTADETDVSPSCVVEVGNVLTAVMVGYGIRSLPFILAFCYSLQYRCTSDTDTETVAHGHAPSVSAAAGEVSPRSRAWLHLVVVIIINCGRIMGLPKLKQYGDEVYKQRESVQPTELSAYFDRQLGTSTPPGNADADCGLAALSPESSLQLLSTNVTEAQIINLLSFRYIASIIADSDNVAIASVFDVNQGDSLQQRLASTCFMPDSLTRVSIPNIISPSTAELCAPNPCDEVRLSLRITEEQQTALSSLHVTLGDVSRPGAQPLDAGLTFDPSTQSLAEQVAAVVGHCTHPKGSNSAASLGDVPPLPLLGDSYFQQHVGGRAPHRRNSSSAAGNSVHEIPPDVPSNPMVALPSGLSVLQTCEVHTDCAKSPRYSGEESRVYSACSNDRGTRHTNGFHTPRNTLSVKDTAECSSPGYVDAH